MPDNPQDILRNYSLLDEFYISDDTSTSVGEIDSNPIDAGISPSSKDADIKKQHKSMMTAVDKIWKGYQQAFDKQQYKDQFNIYPLRDFDVYMAELGAVRTFDGDFIAKKG